MTGRVLTVVLVLFIATFLMLLGGIVGYQLGTENPGVYVRTPGATENGVT